ncbi:hypothetical protein GOV08_00115 [Candidatus Woesearchaeota archaeon]|nr:hypothetical protein [Candidatus Woesearchaeota archaeon]
MAISKSTLLLYYKRDDIRQSMSDGAVDKEVAVRYGDKGFGKRPDMIISPGDILELVKKGATSFHSSEEIWTNPMQLSPNMPKKELESIRKGWDLILDIDCPYWELAKLTAKLMVKALNDNGVKKSVSIKFSGNKGFHIGVPFEAFPKKINVKGDILEIEKLFPDAAKKVALYIVDYIADTYCDEKGNIDDGKKTITLNDIKKITGKKITEFAKRQCSNCSKEIKEEKLKQKTEFICPKCENREVTETDEAYKKCSKCSSLMEKFQSKTSMCRCGSNETRLKFNPLSIVEVDTLLISSRHLYRTEFSMHEKSGLVSVPFNPQKIDSFSKAHAKPENAKVSKYIFLDRKTAEKGEAKDLFAKAYDYQPDISYVDEEKKIYENKVFDLQTEAIPEELFPPCIKKGLEGLEDGKKRFLFILTNFLYSVGWDADMVEKRVNEWNQKNPTPLKEQDVKGHLRYNKHRKEKVLPPNCENKMYYKDFRICFRETESLCQRIKNPVQYSKRRVWMQKRGPKARKKTKTPISKEKKDKKP